MIEKRCSAARSHKPHWWSRTTRRTVVEETAGDTLQCPGSAVVEQVSGKDARNAQIAADARSGTNWASLVRYRPACTCGGGERLLMAAIAMKGMHGIPTEFCTRHPGGTVERKPGGTRWPGENGN
jgi:hypothetical protein